MSIFAGVEMPRVIHQTSSEFNGNIEVVEKNNVRKIFVDGHLQSVSANSQNIERMVWGKIAKLIKSENPDMRRAMILGLGGGTLQWLLATNFPHCHMTSVEIDPVMVDVAKNFFAIEQLQNHKIILDDACRVIASPEEFQIAQHSYDTLVVDIFQGERYPDLGTSGTFLSGIKNVVVPGGLVIFTRLYLDDHQHDTNMFIETVEMYFSNIQSLVVAGKTNSDHALIFGRA
ncbi:MAG: spermidine synthase [Patescibacteria group bacterium]